MKGKIRLAVAGAGLIGRRHVAAVNGVEGAELCAIVEPRDDGKAYAEGLGKPWFASLSDMFREIHPDGVILATPNQVHVENGLECVAEGCPMLIEKPLATSAEEAQVLVDAVQDSGIAVLVGHHRRHNPLIRKARALIDAGELGQIQAVHANCWMYKPDEYFDAAPWRKQRGAGPIAVNLVHDIDLIRFLCGDIVSVQAQSSPSIRGFHNEDVAAAVFRFENGAIGTITVSDTIVSPWSWELTARENPAYPPTAQSCYLLGGTEGSLSLPDLTLWKNNGPRNWWQPISATAFPRGMSDPLYNQVEQFLAVLSGKEEPLVSAQEGMKTLRVMESIAQSAISGETIVLQK